MMLNTYHQGLKFENVAFFFPIQTVHLWEHGELFGKMLCKQSYQIFVSNSNQMQSTWESFHTSCKEYFLRGRRMVSDYIYTQDLHPVELVHKG